MRRVATILSMKQLCGDSSGCLVEAGDADDLGPLAPVADIAGTRLPRYCFAHGTAPVLGAVAPAHAAAKAVSDMELDDASLNSSDSVAASLPDSGADSAGDDLSPAGSVLDLSLCAAAGDAAAAATRAEGLRRSALDAVTLALWDQCAEDGLFRYDVTACPTRVLPGRYGFVAQLNEGRATQKRVTEFKMDRVVQEFDPRKFNFTKAYMREVMYAFEPANHTDAAAPAGCFDPAAAAGPSPNLVLINVSPIDYGHVLLVPRALDRLPQLPDEGTVRLALAWAREAANPAFRVGYNSFGAFASVNHLHFQAYYLALPMPVEVAPTAPLEGVASPPLGVSVRRLVDYPVRAFAIEGADLDAVARVLGAAVRALQAANQPHNFIVTDAGRRTFLFPQCFAERLAQGLVPEDLLATGINPAVFEMTGHQIIKSAADYASFSEDTTWRLLEEASLSEEAFQRVAALCFGGAGAPAAGGEAAAEGAATFAAAAAAVDARVAVVA